MKAVFRRSKPPRAEPPARSKDMSPSRDPAQLAQNDFKSDLPIVGNWDSAHTTIGAGVAIFHLATSRVVLCYHSVDNYWFLPKGRRDCGEDSGAGAEREGFEEVRSIEPANKVHVDVTSRFSLATATAFSPSPFTLVNLKPIIPPMPAP